jgi:phosphomannomutase
VAHVGLCPTPTVGLLVRKLKAAGGICVTASHNPIEYNGLKFFSSAGEFITPDMVEELKKLKNETGLGDGNTRIGKRAVLQDAADYHLQTVLSVLPPPEKVRASKRPKVIIDCCNSAGVEIAPDVADAYGALFQMIHADTSSRTFPRGAEPTEENITALCRAVVKEGADVGFAIDPDADRLALVDEEGRAIGEERTLVLAADAYLTLMKKKTPIVVNLSTSRAIEDVARKHGVKVYRTAIGEANVLAGIRQYKARIGGEGNGGVILPAVQPGRDSATAIALILMGMQARGTTLSQWNGSFPSYTMLKLKIPLARMTPAAALNRVKRAFAREQLDETDGVKVSMQDSWLHVRPSNTEPIIRLFVEARTPGEAQELAERATKVLS